jgi:repressor LexA
MNPVLTDKQISYMDFIQKFITENDNFPTFEVIAEHFGVKANSVAGHLLALRKKGYLDMCPNMASYRRTNIFKSFMAIRERNAA